MRFTPNRIAPLLPYAAVFAGLYGFASAWAAIGFYHAGIVVTLLLTRHSGRRIGLFAGWRTREAVAAGIVGALSGIAVYILWPHAQRAGPHLSVVLERFGLSGVSWWLFAAYLSFVHPGLEELFWRGAVAESRAWNDTTFAGYHVLVLVWFMQPLWVGVSFVVLALTAFVWRSLARRTGGLAVPLFSHCLAGISLMTAVSALRDAPASF